MNISPISFLVAITLSSFLNVTADPDLKLGSAVYKKHCKVCHGDKGDGKTFVANALNPPPKNFTSSASKKELTRERMVESVTEGRKGTAMMPWKSRLSEKEIQSVVSHIRNQFMDLD